MPWRFQGWYRHGRACSKVRYSGRLASVCAELEHEDFIIIESTVCKVSTELGVRKQHARRGLVISLTEYLVAQF